MGMTMALPVIMRASTAVGDNQMLQGLVREAAATWEPNAWACVPIPSVLSCESWANYLTLLDLSFSIHKMGIMVASTSVGCWED